ncbi:aldo/keto reductase [Novosphingobium bradum]|uniref:Aldo/keto reductase n=1 Tax=Novosphingobium bradum TaxID=1737444 RepID=A0ABV7IP09_9SPHN
MNYRQLGRTGAFVSEIALGAGTFGGDPAQGGMLQSTADALVACALEHGVNFFDTADAYLSGQSETLLGHAFRNLGLSRSDIFVSSKVQNPMGPGPNDRGASRLHIMDGVKKSLKRLQLDHLDLYQIHSHDPVTPIEETMRALDDLVSQGLVRYIGASNWRAYRIAKANGIADHFGRARFVTTQGYYCLSARDVERELIPCLEEEGVGLLAWSPLDGGFLTGKFPRDGTMAPGTRQARLQGYPPVNRERAWDCVDVMREIAAEIGATIPRVAIAWVLHRPAVSSVLVGANRVEQLADTLAAAEISLSQDHLDRLDAVSRLPSEYPEWMLTRQAPSRFPAEFKRKPD